MDGGAYGAGKAGAPFDPISFVRRPQVILRALCLLLAIIVFACITCQGYTTKPDGKAVCIYNDDNTACKYGVAIAVMGCLASVGFIGGEYLFEQMSSVKTRKHYVLFDLGFSGLWAFFFFVGFCYLTNAWSRTENSPAASAAATNLEAAIAFSFFSIFTWAACAHSAFQRFQQGVDAAFPTSFEADSVAGGQFTSYPDAADTGYQDHPFGQQQQPQHGVPDFQAPAY